jgi:hypothetical protein
MDYQFKQPTPFERYKKGAKVYLVEFIDKKTNDTFCKIGMTGYKDAMDRFRYDPEQYSKWSIRILATAYNPSKQVIEETEAILKMRYPKNFWLSEKIGGVTEIVKLDKETRIKALKEVRELNEEWKKLYVN